MAARRSGRCGPIRVEGDFVILRLITTLSTAERLAGEIAGPPRSQGMTQGVEDDAETLARRNDSADIRRRRAGLTLLQGLGPNAAE